MNLLEAKIETKNRANQIANEFGPKLRNLFREYIGKKIINKDGTWSKKIKEEVDCYIKDNVTSKYNKCRVIWNKYHYSISVEIEINAEYDYNGEHTSTIYSGTNIGICSLDQGYLSKVDNGEIDFRTDYSVEEITQKRAKYRELKEAADNAYADLSPFGE